jgi:hypothetical protein
MDMWSQMLPLVNFRMPASGDVNMNYHAWTNWGFSASGAGDPLMEREIFANVAMPGRQLGKLIEAVLALAEATQQDGKSEAIEQLKELAEKIEAKKQSLRGEAEESARSVLARLKKVDHNAYCRVLEDAQRNLNDDSPG